MPPLKLSDEILTAALEGYEARKTRIDAQIAEIRAIMGGRSTGTAGSTETGEPRRKVSASARRRMARAQKLRWKKIKQGSDSAPAETAKPKRKLSAAARKSIAAAQKKRWAAVRKAAEPRPAAAKKAGGKKAPAAPAQSVAVA
jgi:hypothetical protein